MTKDLFEPIQYKVCSYRLEVLLVLLLGDLLGGQGGLVRDGRLARNTELVDLLLLEEDQRVFDQSTWS